MFTNCTVPGTCTVRTEPYLLLCSKRRKHKRYCTHSSEPIASSINQSIKQVSVKKDPTVQYCTIIYCSELKPSNISNIVWYHGISKCISIISMHVSTV
jgi:hypothetical protein